MISVETELPLARTPPHHVHVDRSSPRRRMSRLGVKAEGRDFRG
jgi:hypothetical protein